MLVGTDTKFPELSAPPSSSVTTGGSAPTLAPQTYSIPQENVSADDAVQLEIKKSEVPTVEKSEPAPSTNAPDSAAQIKQFEDALNAVRNVSVQFSASSPNSNGRIHFRVIEKETGKVLREFPPMTLDELKKDSQIKDGVGVLLKANA